MFRSMKGISRSRSTIERCCQRIPSAKLSLPTLTTPNLLCASLINSRLTAEAKTTHTQQPSSRPLPLWSPAPIAPPIASIVLVTVPPNLKSMPQLAPYALISVVYIFIFSSESLHRDFLYHSYLSSPAFDASGYSW